MDPRGIKGAWEGLVYYVNEEKTRKIQTLAAHAQWFEDHMPWDPRFRKPQVLGVTAKAIDVVVETGDSGPLTPIGINLPNDQAIREQYGSKSVSLSNVNEAYERSTPEGMRDGVLLDAGGGRARQEVGRVLAGADDRDARGDRPRLGPDGRGRRASPHHLLKEQYSAIEESRADLVALYFLADPEARRARPRRRRRPRRRSSRPSTSTTRATRWCSCGGSARARTIEEDHMRNRQMIVSWLIAHTRRDRAYGGATARRTS